VHCQCDGDLLCRGGKCVAPSGGSATVGGTGLSNTEAAAKLKSVTAGKVALEDDGWSASTWLLIAGVGAAAFFLLRTDDTTVSRLRAEGGAKLKAEYQRRFARGSGVNGLRRRRKSRR
jgi:hypothetical protein